MIHKLYDYNHLAENWIRCDIYGDLKALLHDLNLVSIDFHYWIADDDHIQVTL